jgi:hypothetical protein
VKRLCWIALLFVLPLSTFASDVTMDLSVIGNEKPILSLKTNLPPKSMLIATLVNPIDRGGDGYVGQSKGEVGPNQIVQFGPFNKNGNRLSPGTYHLTVSTVMAALQPEEARPFFGAHGERLTGPHIESLPGTSEKYFSTTFKVTIISNSASSANEHTSVSTDNTQFFKGQCSPATCDGIILIRPYPEKSKDYMMVVFTNEKHGVYGFAGKTYFDPVDADTKMIVDHVYSSGGEGHLYNPNGEESTIQTPKGWQSRTGVCEFFRQAGSLTVVECGQPMWSFRVAPDQ